MLTSLCEWKYGLKKLDVANLEQLESLRPGDVLARRAMFELPEFLRNAIGMLHFGCVSEVNFEKFQQAQTVRKKLNCVSMIHYVRDPVHGGCQVRETNLTYFLFGSVLERKIRDRIGEIETLWKVPLMWILAQKGKALSSPSRSANEFSRTRDQEWLDRQRIAIVAHARATLGSHRYSLLWRNCEHWMQEVVLASVDPLPQFPNPPKVAKMEYPPCAAVEGEILGSSLQVQAVLYFLGFLFVLSLAFVTWKRKKPRLKLHRSCHPKRLPAVDPAVDLQKGKGNEETEG